MRAAIPNLHITAVANSANDASVDPHVPLSHHLVSYLTNGSKSSVLGRPVSRRLVAFGRALRLLRAARRVAMGKAPGDLDQDGLDGLRELTAADALFVSGAGCFNDRYATSVGAVWALVIRCMSLLRKPVILSGQQIGPLDRWAAQVVTRWALTPAKFAGMRDPISLRVSRALGIPADRVGITGDDAWDLPPAPAPVIDALFRQADLPPRFIAAQMRIDRATSFDSTDTVVMANILDAAAAALGLPVVFVRMFYADQDDDLESARRVSALMRAPTKVVEEELDPATTKGILARAVIAIGVSYHFCVFAISSGTPTVGLYRNPYMIQKIRGLEEMWPGLAQGMPLDARDSATNIGPLVSRMAQEEERAGHVPPTESVGLAPSAALESLVLSLRGPRSGL